MLPHCALSGTTRPDRAQSQTKPVRTCRQPLQRSHRAQLETKPASPDRKLLSCDVVARCRSRRSADARAEGCDNPDRTATPNVWQTLPLLMVPTSFDHEHGLALSFARVSRTSRRRRSASRLHRVAIGTVRDYHRRRREAVYHFCRLCRLSDRQPERFRNGPVQVVMQEYQLCGSARCVAPTIW